MQPVMTPLIDVPLGGLFVNRPFCACVFRRGEYAGPSAGYIDIALVSKCKENCGSAEMESWASDEPVLFDPLAHELEETFG